MPRRPLSRRTIGVLAAALLATAAAALLTHGRAADVAQAASPLPPTPAGTLLARMRIVLPTLVLERHRGARARLQDPLQHVRQPLPARAGRDVPLAAAGPDAQLADDERVLRRRIRARQGREPGGPLASGQRGRRGVGVQGAPRARSAACARCATSRDCTRRRAPSRRAPSCCRCPAPASATWSGCAAARSCARAPASHRAASRCCGHASAWRGRSTPRSPRSRTSAARGCRRRRASTARRWRAGSARCASPRTICRAGSTRSRGACGRARTRATACSTTRWQRGSAAATARSVCAAARVRSSRSRRSTAST